MKRARIVIEVDRKDGELTDADLRRVAVACAHVIEGRDEECDPLVGAHLGGGLIWGYDVREVPR